MWIRKNHVKLGIISVYLLLLADCKEHDEDFDSHRIIGGRYAKKGEFPFMVVISSRPRASSCGGGLLSSLYVLTACHCTSKVIEEYGNHPEKVSNDYSSTRVVAGTVSRDPPQDQGYQLRWVYKWMQHPNCTPLLTGEWLNDIAVIEVSERFIFNELVQPLNIPKSSEKLSETIKMWQILQGICIISGWGYTAVKREYINEIHSNSSAYLKTLVTRLLPPYYCNLLLCEFSRYFKCVDNFSKKGVDRLCAVARLSWSGTVCGGDSGGPLICNGVAVAVVSYSSGCSLRDDPVVYARIDTAYDFISQYYINSPNYNG